MPIAQPLTEGDIVLFDGVPAIILETRPSGSLMISTFAGIESYIGTQHGGLAPFTDEDPSPVFAARIAELREFYEERVAREAAIGARYEKALDELEYVGPTRDIVGYVYRADGYKPSALIKLLLAEGRLSPGALGMDPDEALDQLAAVEDVNRDDEYSFDTDDFPKTILRHELSEHDLDWLTR